MMATTATAPSSAANGAASAATASASAAATRPQLKSTISGTPNGGNANRRSVQSPIDGAQRRNTSRGPWQASLHQKYNGSSTNPITSSSPTPSQAAAMKTRNPTLSSGGESDTHDKHMHDRTLFLLGNLITKTVTITLKTGARYTGILVGADTKNHDIGVVMKWVRLVRAPLGDNGDEKVEEGEYVGGGPEKTMIFEPRDLVDIFVEKIVLGEAEGPANHQNGTFRTDADISGNLAMRERELHRWQPDEVTNNLSLEESTPGPQGQGWNQFEANERLFGVTSDFNEDIYTTKLDRAHPLYQQREAAAARIAREIEGQTTGTNMNLHVAEERNIAFGDDSGIDEEDRYGAVQRAPMPSNLVQAQVTNSRYTPPALRAPTGHPTVPGAPHDPAIIASQLVRPETIQQKQQQAPQAPRATLPQINLPQQQTAKPEEASHTPKEKPPLPEIIAPKRMPISGAPEASLPSQPPLPEVTREFKQFVNMERERFKKKKADLEQRGRAIKLEELKKFSINFTLRTEVPQDLVPILAKDKQKQAEIVEKAKANVAKAAPPTLSSTPQTPKPPGTKELPPNSFALKNPIEFQNMKQQLLHGFPQRQQRPQSNQQPTAAAPLSIRLNQIQDAKNRGQQLPHVRSPVPIPEHPQNVPTGPAAGTIPMAPKSTSPASMSLARMNAKAMEFKPNPSAATFTPNFGPSTTATPSPTNSAPTQPSPRATSPSIFFGNKKPSSGQERRSIKNSFNPIKRMKATHKTTPTQVDAKKPKGNPNDFIDLSFHTAPTWPTTEGNEERTYVQMFAKTEFSTPSTMHSPQPPHIAPHQPHHHQQGPPHITHVNQPPHVSHQSHHPHMPQHHLGVPPPHYEQDQHLRQIPPSVMPSPSLHNATLAPYQQSPVAHHSQLPMYTAHPPGQYVPGGPGAPFVGQFYSGGFRGPAGAGPMMVPGSQPIPYPSGQFLSHTQIFSPQQPHAYMHNGAPPPPPTSSQGYPSPGRSAPMMIHQGSSQGTPTGPQMIPYAMPGQGGPIYGQGQQQSELFLQGQNWLPQRPQSTVSLPPAPSSPVAKFGFGRAVSPAAVPSPRVRNSHLSPQPSAASPLLMSSMAVISPAPSASDPGLSSYPLQRGRTGNTPMHAGGGARGGKQGSNSGGGGMMVPMIPTSFIISTYSNDGSVGMMRGQPLPHQGGPPYYHSPQGHYPPGGRGNTYGGHPQQQHQGGQHAPLPPPLAQPQQTAAEGESGK